MFLGTPDATELLALSGQSRLYLHLRHQHSVKPSNHPECLLLKNDMSYPDFPGTLEEEAVIFRKHGLPLLALPSGCTTEELQAVCLNAFIDFSMVPTTGSYFSFTPHSKERNDLLSQNVLWYSHENIEWS
ncbi:hypothetical protein FBUS_11328 [Fasciolopsis buskii]|uniref:Uncharacterized protein n=1 Tax=Fasciolopsis buskii TaxID=27845 RepID=A0A8E0VHP2_9TREM|nr:hypothetical protein FBUS_11328 [Fasciolopsis buski]